MGERKWTGWTGLPFLTGTCCYTSKLASSVLSVCVHWHLWRIFYFIFNKISPSLCHFFFSFFLFLEGYLGFWEEQEGGKKEKEKKKSVWKQQLFSFIWAFGKNKKGEGGKIKGKKKLYENNNSFPLFLF